MKRDCFSSFAPIERKGIKAKHDLSPHFLIRISCDLKTHKLYFEKKGNDFLLGGHGDWIRGKCILLVAMYRSD